MALEFRLSINGEKSLRNDFLEYFSYHKIPYNETYSDKIITYDVYNSLGCVITYIVERDKYLEYESFYNESIIKTFESSTGVSFRIRKLFDEDIDLDYNKIFLNMIEIVLFLLGKNKEDSVFMFNGETLILEVKEGKMLVGDHDFWSCYNLVDKIPSDAKVFFDKNS